ncbi:MAG: DegT/DnrJ/EryC1/StrS family aminotransferase [Thiothrix sp.]|uniref:DegT/DnrJ/EryC1/StrS family aminotransferase n=1 Tax=Thiothrix sp. TaxID=1032 RepID=UPI00261C2AAA|nr:DegT/DnrJ/EryC1/StrS family aminotransferase [Thiothrix sp.]MDD5392914.1 DegT/DnrJ/EryC1/StrS family aminotransferase [Thiothrix sp.]
MPGYEVIGNEELAEVQDVFSHGGILFRHGFDGLRNNCYKVKEFEQIFAQFMGVNHALAVSSGTAALRVALAALGIGLGDEVITQSFTFVATVEAIIEARAVPVCADIDTTLNMDPADLERRITPRTKAVIVVHMLGIPARLPEITEICRRHNLLLIEDTAWGCGGTLQNKPLGSWGDIGTFSFDFAKTMTTGEGGMLVFRDEVVYQRAAAWHDHGHENNPAVPRWEDTRASSGFNYRMMELQGAIGLAQLKKLPAVIASQRENKAALWQAIADLQGIEAREMPEGSLETADALVFLVRDSTTARRCRDELLKVGLATKILPEAYSWHFAGTWNHMPELVNAHGGDLATAFSTSHEILSRAVSLPVGVKLAENAPEKARTALNKVLAG